MHVAYIILILKNIFEKTKIPKTVKEIFTIILLITLMFITSFTPTVVRACIMAIMLAISNMIYRKSDIFTTLNIALIITLIYNPFLITDIGLLLSYGGTLGIILLNKKIGTVINNMLQKLKLQNKIIDYLKEIIVISISVQIIITPIMITYFNKFSLIFFISNILIAPIMGGIILLGFLNLTGFFLFSFLLNILLQLLIKISDFCANIPFSNYLVTTPNISLIIAYYIFITLFFTRYDLLQKYKKKILAVFLIIVIVLNTYKIIPKDLRIYFIDVGQGDSTLIITPSNKKILIDGGGDRELDGFDVGQSVVVPYLLDRGIKTLDYVLISHFDADHCNGLIYLLKNLNVKQMVISKQTEETFEYEYIIDIIKTNKIPVKIVQKGDVIVVDRYVYFDILYPDFKLSKKDLNNNAMVAKLKYNNFSMLFTGDIEESAEKYLVGADSISARITIHDIKNSTSWFKNIFNRKILKCSKP